MIGGNEVIETVGRDAAPPASREEPVVRVRASERPLNQEFHAKLRRRLRENVAALEHLKTSGLTATTMDHFGLGLSTPYPSRKTRLEQADALVFPVVNAAGAFINKYGYCNIPGVTKNPQEAGCWMSGEARTYYSDTSREKRSVFVCGDVREVWLMWQAFAGTRIGSDLLFISSTHSHTFPAEWENTGFWAGWEEIYLGQDSSEVGEILSNKLAAQIGREVRRVPPPSGTGWVDYWRSGETLEQFIRLLESAPFLTVEIDQKEDDGASPGRFGYQPVNINGAFHGGHFYYTVRVLNRSVDVEHRETGEDVVQQVERLETVVIKSDRSVHTIVTTPAPKGTRFEDRVMRLTDGTLIDRPPTPNRYGTWSWHSIKSYLADTSKIRKLKDILVDVMRHLRTSVWLPHDEDYAILALTVPVTYAQALFDSVPIIFLHGPPGSGKSETGRAMARVCANAYVCGQSSAASIARFIDESRGFVVLDDLEMIGGRGGEFSELVQALKLSYNKETAVKLWTDVKTMRIMRLNFYGVKMINNTRGADEILASRMLRIQTRAIPNHLKAQFQAAVPTEAVRLRALRDELHTWTFENVAQIYAEYRTLYPKRSDRSTEITAALRVMSSLSGDTELGRMLELALLRQRQRTLEMDDPLTVMKLALGNLAACGYETVSVSQVALEMRSLLSLTLGSKVALGFPEWTKPEWVGRKLRAEGLVDASESGARRIRVWGMNLRFYPVEESFLRQVKATQQRDKTPPVELKAPQDFCRTCDSCQYRDLSCEIMVRRKSGR